MNKRLMPTGHAVDGQIVAKVGNGKNKTPLSLAARMPSAEIAAKVGTPGIGTTPARRVVRRSVRG